MPTYSYRCLKCDEGYDVIKPISKLEDKEKCPKCSKAMKREIAAVRISTSTCTFQAHYNWGLGKEVHSKRQLNETVRRMRGETGKDIVEVGNDTLQSVKKQRKKYDDNIRLGDFK